MKIDSHVHIGPWKYAPFYGLKNSVDKTARDYLRWGFSGAIVTGTDALNKEALLRRLRYRQERRFRFWYFPWVKSRRDLPFLRKYRPFISGIKLHPAFSRTPVSDPQYRPLIEYAAREHLPMLVHTGRWVPVSGFQHLLSVARHFPNATFIAGHAGGANTTLKMEMVKALLHQHIQNVYLELSGCFEFWILEYAVHQLPTSRFLFGSDYPTVDPRVHLGVLRSARISASARNEILGRNFQAIATRNHLTPI